MKDFCMIIENVFEGQFVSNEDDTTQMINKEVSAIGENSLDSKVESIVGPNYPKENTILVPNLDLFFLDPTDNGRIKCLPTNNSMRPKRNLSWLMCYYG